MVMRLGLIISYAILTGLEYLHNDYKIIQRDIKQSNVLMDCHGEVKNT